MARFRLGRLLFSSSIENDPEKMFVTTNGLPDATYSLIKGISYQVIGIINLNKINENWNEINKSSTLVSVNFQSQADNSQTRHFSSNFKAKNVGDIFHGNWRMKGAKTLSLKTVKKSIQP